MRDNFNMLPIVQDNMNCVPGIKSMTSISSNGYYGYQPPLNKLKEEQQPPSYMEVEHDHGINNRKRNYNYQDDFREFKKRRQNGKNFMLKRGFWLIKGIKAK